MIGNLDKNWEIIKTEKIDNCRYCTNELYTIKNIKTNEIKYINDLYFHAYNDKNECINAIINFKGEDQC